MILIINFPQQQTNFMYTYNVFNKMDLKYIYAAKENAVIPKWKNTLYSMYTKFSMTRFFLNVCTYNV